MVGGFGRGEGPVPVEHGGVGPAPVRDGGLVVVAQDEGAEFGGPAVRVHDLVEDDRRLRDSGGFVGVPDGLPLLGPLDGCVPFGEVVARTLVHLFRDDRPVPVDGVPDVRGEDPQRPVLAVHVTQDVDPQVGGNGEVGVPEQDPVGLARLPLVAADGLPEEVGGRGPARQSCDLAGDLREEALVGPPLRTAGLPLRRIGGPLARGRPVQCDFPGGQQLPQPGQVGRLEPAEGDPAVRVDEEVLGVELVGPVVPAPHEAPGPGDVCSVGYAKRRSVPCHAGHGTDVRDLVEAVRISGPSGCGRSPPGGSGRPGGSSGGHRGPG